MSKSSHPIRLAVVGGRRGGNFGTALNFFSDRIKLTAVCDLSEEIRNQWQADHPAVQGFADYSRMLAADVCDAVLIATPMLVHAEQAIAALRAGKHVLSEVTACVTHDEAVALIDAVETTGLTYMMAENYTYMRPHMMLRNMVERGVFGELTYAEGMYLHDCRSIKINADGSLTWRGELARDMEPNCYYPTHSLGPIAQWLDLGRSDQLKSVYCAGTPAVSMAHYAKRFLGEDHPGAQAAYWRRCDNSQCLITTQRGRVISLRVDSSSSRPHHMFTHELQGTTGCFRTDADADAVPNVWLDGRSPGTPLPPGQRSGNEPMKWEPLYQYADEFEHPRWKAHQEMATKAGHGGGDFFVIEDFVNAIDGRQPSPIDVYDAVAWSSIIWLSAESIRTGKAVEATDYRALKSSTR